MAVYRFKVSFEDYDDVIREVDIKSTHTFEELHKAIHLSTGYKAEYPSSFYVSNDQWIKGQEIAYMPNQRRIDRGVPLMEKAKLSNFIDDPHQKFYYTFNFDRPFDFHIELIKILNETPGVEYPFVAKSVGEAPKQFGNIFNAAATAAPAVDDDFDFLNQLELVAEETEDFEEVSDPELPAVKSDDHDEEDDDGFGDEFADNEHFDEEPNDKEEY